MMGRRHATRLPLCLQASTRPYSLRLSVTEVWNAVLFTVGRWMCFRMVKDDHGMGAEHTVSHGVRPLMPANALSASRRPEIAPHLLCDHCRIMAFKRCPLKATAAQLTLAANIWRCSYCRQATEE